MPPGKTSKGDMRRESQAYCPDFNQAMIYSSDVARSLCFYADGLGFKPVDEFWHGERLLYARLRAPKGVGTIAIHMLEPGKSIPAHEGVRLYFEVKELKKFCGWLEKKGVKFSQLPKKMPWGWEHAYLDDPDGHEISLYWAGAKRFRKTRMAKSKTRRKN